MNEPRHVPAWEDPRRALARHGLTPKRGFSQSFLVARGVVEAIAEAVVPSHPQGRSPEAAAPTVVELGPGLGTLTAALLRRGARVIAVERDRDMLQVLSEDLLPSGGLTLIAGDAASTDLVALANEHGGRITLTGNLPYAITGAILRRIVDAHAHLERVVIMVQKEVQARLLAAPGTREWGIPSVFTQAVFRVLPVRTVAPTAFHPRPRVTSAVVALEPRHAPRARITPAFEAVVKAAFGTRRKTLRNALSRLAEGDAARVERSLTRAGIDPARRGETLTIEELDELARSWELS